MLAASSGLDTTAARSNSVAASLGLPEPAAIPTEPTPSAAIAADASVAAKDHQLENPGTVEELHKKCKGMQCHSVNSIHNCKCFALMT